MKPPVDIIRVSKQGRDQLSKLRRQTGIENWNILCRWAFCASIKETTPPPAFTEKLEGGVEMTWKVFAGEMADILAALAWMRTRQDGLPMSPDGVAQSLRGHIHRGLGYLTSGNETKSVSDFTARWLKETRDPLIAAQLGLN